MLAFNGGGLLGIMSVEVAPALQLPKDSECPGRLKS